jgi:dethiobiotin synthetase
MSLFPFSSALPTLALLTMLSPVGSARAAPVRLEAEALEYGDRAGQSNSHAAEVVVDAAGSWFVTHAGWGQGGLWLAPLIVKSSGR